MCMTVRHWWNKRKTVNGRLVIGIWIIFYNTRLGWLSTCNLSHDWHGRSVPFGHCIVIFVLNNFTCLFSILEVCIEITMFIDHMNITMTFLIFKCNDNANAMHAGIAWIIFLALYWTTSQSHWSKPCTAHKNHARNLPHVKMECTSAQYLLILMSSGLHTAQKTH